MKKRLRDETRFSSEFAYVFNRSGNMLWRSPAFTDVGNAALSGYLLGDGWQEFLVTEELDRVLAWFDSDGAGTAFYAKDPMTGQIVRVYWVKATHGENWLIISRVDHFGNTIHGPPW